MLVNSQGYTEADVVDWVKQLLHILAYLYPLDIISLINVSHYHAIVSWCFVAYLSLKDENFESTQEP